MSSGSNSLPPKEHAIFKRILKCYEQKQYRNGLKFAKQILSQVKFQEHGETLAMKGLIMHSLGRKEEGYDLVRRGLRNDLKSHVCWHVYGLLQRSEKRYDEAIKCYMNALKWDSDNIQILRDLSLLQIQMRDLPGYKDTRYQLFQLRPTQRASWIGLAMAYHLLGDYDMALKILEEFRKTQEKAVYDYEYSELLLYQNMVIFESGNIDEAMKHLDQFKEQICDEVIFLETRAKYVMAQGHRALASTLYRQLLERNPEKHAYYDPLLEAEGAGTEDRKLAVFKEMGEKFVKAQAPQRLALNVATGENFKVLVGEYIKKALRKGIPPLFVDLKPLYKDPLKAQIIEDLCLSYQTNLVSGSSFDIAKGKDDGQPLQKEPETALLWLLYFLAHHYDFQGNSQKALEVVNQAMEHTPTLIELFLLKGKIYKHAGNMEKAVACLDEAQSLDTADRYINCKCAKYMLRANMVCRAAEMCQKFTREGIPAMENLNEMQCMWFQTECAMAFKRLGNYGEALKKCIEIDRHFTEIIEDQFDFHTYCLRKMTLRSYVDLLRVEDVLRNHPFYVKAAHCAINVYLRLHDKPLKDVGGQDDLITENMDPSELKKYRNKLKKAKRKAEQEKQGQQQAAAKKELHNKSQKQRNEEEYDLQAKDELIPEKLERPADPMAEATKFLAPLQALCSKDLNTHILAFEVSYRKRKPLLMLQSVKRARKLVEVFDPRLHSCVVRMQHFMAENASNLSQTVQAVVKRETEPIFGTKTAKERNEEFMQMSNSYDHLSTGARMMALLEPSIMEKIVKKVTELDPHLYGMSHEKCWGVYESLSEGKFGTVGQTVADSYRTKCSEVFPLASRFQTSSTSGPGNHINNNGKAVEDNNDRSSPAPHDRSLTTAAEAEP